MSLFRRNAYYEWEIFLSVCKLFSPVICHFRVNMSMFFEETKMFLWTRRIIFWYHCLKLFAEKSRIFRSNFERKCSSILFPKWSSRHEEGSFDSFAGSFPLKVRIFLPRLQRSLYFYYCLSRRLFQASGAMPIRARTRQKRFRFSRPWHPSAFHLIKSIFLGICLPDLSEFCINTTTGSRSIIFQFFGRRNFFQRVISEKKFQFSKFLVGKGKILIQVFKVSLEMLMFLH